jgi:hypothetical protein
MDTIESSVTITPIILPPLNPNVNAAFSYTSRPRPQPLIINNNSHGFDICKPPYVDLEELENSIIRNIDDTITWRMFKHKKMDAIAIKSSSEMHNQWRKVFIEQNGDVPCIKKTKDGIEVDINVDSSLLNAEFFKFNYNIAIFVAICINFYPCKTIEEVSSIIHKKLGMMTPGVKDSPLDISYISLPEIEKEKARVIFRIVSSSI